MNNLHEILIKIFNFHARSRDLINSLLHGKFKYPCAINCQSFYNNNRRKYTRDNRQVVVNQ